MGSLISPELLPTIESLARQDVHETDWRRARILLLYHEGRSTREIAQALAMSEARVRHWRREFLVRGVDIFSGAVLDATGKDQGDGRAGEEVPAIPEAEPPELDNPSLYINRELSLLEFQRRVLDEAKDRSNPLLERLKFVGIVSSNLDEFFMVRVGGLKMQMAAGIGESAPDATTPAEQLATLRKVAKELMLESRSLLRDELMPELDRYGIHLRNYEDLTEKQKNTARDYFDEYIFPVLTPMAFDPGHPFPHISNLSLNLAVMVRHKDGLTHFARLKVPGSIPRLIPVKRSSGGVRKDGTVPYNHYFVWVEQVIAANLESLFPGLEIVESHPFRVTRNADMNIQELEASDLLESVEQSIRQRRFGSVVRVSANPTMPDHLQAILRENLDMDQRDVYLLEGPLGLSGLMGLASLIDRHDLSDPPFLPATPSQLAGDSEKSIFAAIRAQNFLIHHPYDSFDPVLKLLNSAAIDPGVLAIKMTLYRVGKDAPVVKALLRARERGKQVTVLVELKARFDEESNIGWAKMLEEAGVHVIYGLLGLKTHSKIALVVRSESGKIRRYMHLATGNYNAVTAHLYEDLGFFTCDEDIGADASDLFNYLTGYSEKSEYRKLLVAPINLRDRMESLIRREIEHQKSGRGGLLVFKMNSLVDKGIVRLLYEASQAGVRVDLVVRGICVLRPGIPGVSDNITVRSIVGRFLEHSRIFYFRNDGNEEVYLGSADMMPRNLDRRVEVLFPVEDGKLIRRLHDRILATYMSDNVKMRWMESDGSYPRPTVDEEAERINAQQHFIDVSSLAAE
jgi:polyphosphate kinase